MLITAVCPACETSYKVQRSLRGQPMRCPNPDCRTVFTVPAEEPAAPPKPAPPRPQPSNGPRSGPVGDIVPILPAQTETPTPGSLHVSDMIPLVEGEAVPAPTAKVAPSWETQAPPVRRPIAPSDPTPAPPLARNPNLLPVRRPTTPSAPTPAPRPAVPDGPSEVPAGKWDAKPPPVRRGQPAAPTPPAGTPAAPTAEVAAAEAPEEHAAADEPIHHPPGRRVGWIVAVLALTVVLVLGGGAAAVWWIMLHSEGAMSQEAERTYKAGQFLQAVGQYKDLWDQFPTSDKRDSYLFMQKLSELRNKAAAPDPDIASVLDDFFTFLSDNEEHNKASLTERAPDLGETIVRLAEGYLERHPQPADETTPLHVMDRLQKAFDAVAALDLGDAEAPLRGRLAHVSNTVREGVQRLVARNQSVGNLKEAMNAKTPSLAVRQFSRQLKEERARVPDIDKDPEVVDMQKQVYANHLSGVVYSEKESDLPPARRENDDATLVVNPLLRGTPGKAPAGDPVKLALARGVLYALKQTNGDTKWAVRVGVDTTALPVRVPATETSPERILVPSADALTLAALDPNGERLWEYPLSGQCLGRPLVIGNLAYVPTYDGKVHVIELAQGKLKGVYDLGQPLTCGGARQPDTNLLYFPADDFCVYVLDVQQQRCVNILYTGHPAGSVRGEPLILTPDPVVGESWLVLNQTHGLDETEMHVYRLPLQDKDQPPEKLDPPPAVPGWTWFPPAHDGEKVAMLGDTGVLGLFGIRQSRNLNDPPLFPLLPKFDLAAGAAAKDRGRSEVVEMQDQDLCVLARGRLQRLLLELNAVVGPRLEPAANWEAPVLGSPLHASQVEPHPLGGATLYLVTQPLQQQTCLATAVDDREGDVLWQRQLGPGVPGRTAGAAAAGRRPGAGAADAGPRRRPVRLRPRQARRPQGRRLARRRSKPVPGAGRRPRRAPVVLPGPDGQSAYEIASPGDGTQLVVRRVELTATGLVPTERIVPLTSPLAGTPAVTSAMLVLPLAKGVLARLTLPLAAKPVLEEGPNWRWRAPPDAVGRVTALADGTFLTGDGARGLTHWDWMSAREWKAFPAGKEERAPTLELENTLTADPVLLPAAKDSPARLCIADAAGVVSLLTVRGDGGLKKGRSWNLGPRHRRPLRPDLAGRRDAHRLHRQRNATGLAGSRRRQTVVDASSQTGGGPGGPAAAGRRRRGDRGRVGPDRRPRPGDGPAGGAGVPAARQHGAGRDAGGLRGRPPVRAAQRRHGAAAAAEPDPPMSLVY